MVSSGEPAATFPGKKRFDNGGVWLVISNLDYCNIHTYYYT